MQSPSITNHRDMLHLCTADEFAQCISNTPDCTLFAVKISKIMDTSTPRSQHMAPSSLLHRPDQPAVTTASAAAPGDANTTACADSHTTQTLTTQWETKHKHDTNTTTRWNKLCDEYQDIFTEPQGIPPDRPIKHKIELLDPAQPIKHHRQYRMSQSKLDEVRTQLDSLLTKGWIRPSTS